MPDLPAPPTRRTKKQAAISKDTKRPTSFQYNERNDGADLYGVMVVWDQKGLSTKKLEQKFSGVLAARKARETSPQEQPPPPKPKPGRTLKRKPFPYFRRIGPTKAIIAFQTWKEANEFNKAPHMEFRTFIPMSFVVTVGRGELETPTGGIQTVDLYPFSAGYEVVHARKKDLKNGQTQVTVAIRGYELPKQIYIKDRFVTLERNPREAVICFKCLRFGHRQANCFRKTRCGACVTYKPRLRHREKKCFRIKSNENRMACLHCNERHMTGLAKEECSELGAQGEFKNQLNLHRLDFVNTLEAEIIPQIRTTAINSNRMWLNQ